MDQKTNRIYVIDALRGFALLAICLIHSMEHFECYFFPEASSPAIAKLNDIFKSVVTFLFAGKSYAIFSLLFGLSFFIQYDNQARKGKDFRLRFAWRMIILYVFGFLNAWLYFGEIFEAYAVMGLALIPICKLSDRWLKVVAIILVFQLPNLIWFIVMLFNPSIETYPFYGLGKLLGSGYFGSPTAVFKDGSLCDVLTYNFWSQGRMLKWAWFFWSSRVVHIIGLFAAGMLIGRLNIHNDETKMIKYSKWAIGFGFVIFPVFYCLHSIISMIVTDNPLAVQLGEMTFKYYYELGQMFIIIGMFVLTYFLLGAKNTLDKIAPVGRMSVTNYMVQTIIGTFLFYGYGLGLAKTTGYASAALIGIVLCIFQIIYSNYWMKHFYYGPMEWLWRSLTLLSFKKIAFKIKKEN